MKSLSFPARVYIALVSACAFAVAGYSTTLVSGDMSLWLIIVIAAIIITALDAVPIKLYGSSIEATTSNVAKFALVLLFPLAVPILATFLGTLLAEWNSKRIWFKRLFNVSQMTLTWAVVAFIYSNIDQRQYDFIDSAQNIAALFLAGLSNYVVNAILLALVISLAAGVPFRHVLMQDFPRIAFNELSIIPLGTFVAILWRYNPISIPLVALPLFVVRHSYQTANYLQRQTEDALRAMMRAIDERDNETFDHSERVSELAKEIGMALDMYAAELDVLVPAALLHDLGKIGMAGAILFKPGVLTEEERRQAQKHAAIGGELLSKFPLFEKGALLVRHHHERYDGTGYPDQLKGDQIPLGARIIAVADSFRAMTEDRPYRKALGKDEALAEIIRCSGTQFDPQVVRALMQCMGKDTPIVAAAINTTALLAEGK